MSCSLVLLRSRQQVGSIAYFLIHFGFQQSFKLDEVRRYRKEQVQMRKSESQTFLISCFIVEMLLEIIELIK